MKNEVWIPGDNDVNKILAVFAEDKFRLMLVAAIISQQKRESVAFFNGLNGQDFIVWN